MKKLELLWQTFLSVVKILLQSKWRTHLPSSFSNPEELLILANGPSLNRTVREAPDFVQGKTLLAVNFCVTSPMFEQLRPEIYLIASVLDCSREAGTIVPDACRKNCLADESVYSRPCFEEQRVAAYVGG